MACRVGKPGAITSNISGGGRAIRVETVLRKVFSGANKVNQIIETIIFVAINAVAWKIYLGNCGEVGVD